MDDRRPPSQEDGILIRLQQVGKTYKSGALEVDALKHVDHYIHQGEFGAINEVAARIVVTLGLARKVEVAIQVPALGEVPRI